MRIKDLVKYTTHTPCNTNPNLVANMGKILQNNVEDFYRNKNLTKIEDYLYEITYTDWDYHDAESYVEASKATFGCSSARIGNFYGRNYDWNYDYTVDFIVKCQPTDQRHSSIGVASIKKLTKQNVEELFYNEYYEILPMLTLDGINDAGVVANINIVPLNDKDITTGTNPGKPRLCANELVRFILDYADSAADAVEKIKQLDIYAPVKNGHEIHCMVADANDTFVIEFVNNKMVVIDEFIDNKPIMTNFYLDGFDGSKATLTPFGAGFERYEKLSELLDSIEDSDDMLNAMIAIRWTHAYDPSENPQWYSEWVGDYTKVGLGILTNESPDEDFEPVIEYGRELFANRSRDTADTWQTVHTSVFDLENSTMTVVVQEGNTTHTYSLEE